MNDKIAQLCKDIEKEHQVKILFAIENGSRAWRMASEDSDYDVRFVFVRSLDDYLSLRKKADVITAAFDKEGKPCSVEGAEIDMSGFDIYKYVNLLASSNPTTIEWLMSDIVYYGTQNDVFRAWAADHFNPLALYYHYQSMCKNNYLKYLKTGSFVTYKKYLYAYRGLVNALWVKEKDSVPPIVFTEALNGLKNVLPESILKRLLEIIKLKSSGKEKDIIENIKHMDDYIEKFLKKDSPPEKVDRESVEVLEEELKRIVKA